MEEEEWLGLEGGGLQRKHVPSTAQSGTVGREASPGVPQTMIVLTPPLPQESPSHPLYPSLGTQHKSHYWFSTVRGWAEAGHVPSRE
jgi:hypothetical protein